MSFARNLIVAATLLLPTSLAVAVQPETPVVNYHAAFDLYRHELSAAQVAGVMLTVDRLEDAAARLALMRSSNVYVRNYAKRMIHDHAQSTRDTMGLLQNMRMLPMGSELAGYLAQLGLKATARVAMVPRREFDRAFMNAEVALHRAVLDNFTVGLMQSFSAPRLQGFLNARRILVTNHYEEAIRIRDSIPY